MTSQDPKAAFRRYCEAFSHPASDGFCSAVEGFFASDAAINVVHPFNDLIGPDAYHGAVIAPLLASFNGLFRTQYIAFGGAYDGSDWVTCTGYYSGHFANAWLGIPASDALAHLRFGEFHRMVDGQAVESYIFFDIPELMIARGVWPETIPSPAIVPGFTGYLPGPASQDGLRWGPPEIARGTSSYQMVTDMLGALATEDEAWRPYWHDNMLWFGPAAFGSFVGVEKFAAFQVPFEGCFAEWIGGSKPGSLTKHFTRFGDGDYVCSGGWPSLNCVQIKPFLGQEPTGERLFVRVCDWWRREADLLVENWVFVDIPHVLLQLGLDIFADRARVVSAHAKG